MDVPEVAQDDVLAAPTRARLFAALARLRRPASTPELARLVDRHPNTVRVALQRMEAAGLVECRTVAQARGRPRHAWAIVPDARPGDAAPQAHSDLSRWLARAMRRGHTAAAVESEGRDIGHELAPDGAMAAADADAMQDALTALGFAPRAEARAHGELRYVLANCPYREAVAVNPAVVCSLHRGITQGLVDRLDPRRRLTGFVPKDPFTAGCLIELSAG
jgi:predicted ArsR family transcriptional regulator